MSRDQIDVCYPHRLKITRLGGEHTRCVVSRVSRIVRVNIHLRDVIATRQQLHVEFVDQNLIVSITRSCSFHSVAVQSNDYLL